MTDSQPATRFLIGAAASRSMILYPGKPLLSRGESERREIKILILRSGADSDSPPILAIGIVAFPDILDL